MITRLLLLVALVPLIELAILIRLGGWIGFWPTIGVLLAAGAIGTLLARSQGTRVLRDIQADVAAGRVPADRLVDGALILAGGMMLIIPGLISDTVGILLLLPPVRGRLKDALRKRISARVRSGEVAVVTLRP